MKTSVGELGEKQSVPKTFLATSPNTQFQKISRSLLKYSVKKSSSPNQLFTSPNHFLLVSGIGLVAKGTDWKNTFKTCITLR